MATYTYNGKVLVKNSKREDYRFAVIDKNTGKKLSISSTATGAMKEINSLIASSEARLDYSRRALIAIDFGKDEFTYKEGRKFYKKAVTAYKNYNWLSEEVRSLSPKEYYSKMFNSEARYLESLKENYILVEVERS